jgi:hypothetical protein
MSGAIVAGSIAAGAGLAGAGISAHAAGSAADKQTQAANSAAQLQYQESQNALDFQKQQWNQTQQNAVPWLQQGGAAENQLGYLLGLSPNASFGQPNTSFPSSVAPTPQATQSTPSMGSINSGLQTNGAPTANPALGVGGASGLNLTGSPSLPSGGMVPRAGAVGAVPSAGSITSGLTSANPAGGGSAGGGFGSLLTPYSGHFTAPDGITMQNDPGYQERLNIGKDILERSAAARGGVLTGGTAKALDTYGQDYASNEYGNVYNRALQGFQTNYNQYNNDQNNVFNRLSALAGGGQTQAAQLASAGQNAANNVSSNLLNTGSQIGQQYNNAGAANASGIVGGANAWNGALGGIGGNLQQLMLLKQLGLGGNSADPTINMVNSYGFNG